MLNRRIVLQRLMSMPFLGGFLGGLAAGRGTSEIAHAVPGSRDYFQELGVRTFINAAGTLTSLTGCLMPEEVVDAIEYARRHYVGLDEIQDRVGERIAELLGCESATVTSGAFSAMTLGLAGVMCGMDTDKVSQLPDTTGLKNEVIKLKSSHYVSYVHALVNAGATVIEVDTLQELEDSISDRTAMLFVLNAYNDSQIAHEEVVAAGKKHGIPTFNDCAADVPPVENLWKYTDMGYDLVAFSGGKGIKGPQSAGLLLGRRDLIAAARLHAPPRGDTIGRGMKVNKEEVLAMLVALEMYLEKDHEREWRLWESQIEHISDAVTSVAGTETEHYVPEVANHVPTLRITWDEDRIQLAPAEAKIRLRDGHPSIEMGGGSDGLSLSTWMMRPGEERIVGRRIREVLTEAST